MSMHNPTTIEILEAIRRHGLESGGFAMLPGGGYRPDPTAWAVLALTAGRSDGRDDGFIESSRDRLATDQQKDGRVSISPSTPEAFWPTPLAVLAWGGSPEHVSARSNAVTFLLSVYGKHWNKLPDSPLAHDTSLRGWSWTEGTHSWVEPTSMALLALKTAGYGNHARVKEGVEVLMDRQLPSGGWNYGNTSVYDHEMRPQPDMTGIALVALVGLVQEKELKRSLKYLQESVSRLKTPRSLGWAILGLGAWQSRPMESERWIGECVKRQERYGTYDTTLLSLLLLAWMSKRGLASPYPMGKGKS